MFVWVVEIVSNESWLLKGKFNVSGVLGIQLDIASKGRSDECCKD